MGCVFSRQEFDNPRIFQVWNVDSEGRHVKPGRIEVTESQLILYQKGDIVIRWPLRSLRRYGFDAELFSFECGRRCPTGPGVYAFKCRRAEGLFNILQECIQNSGTPSSVDEQVALHSPPPAAAAAANGNLLESASGYLEPIVPSSRSPGGYVCIHETRQYANCCTYVNGGPQSQCSHCVDFNTNYAKLDDLLKQESLKRQKQQQQQQQQHFYVNVHSCSSTDRSSPARCYANLASPESSPPQVNYAELDLDQSSPVNASCHSLCNSPVRSPEGYAQIDFDKTVALSHSSKTPFDDESIRKTRHNAAATN